MDLFTAGVEAVAKTSEARDRKKMNKEQLKAQEITLEMEKEKQEMEKEKHQIILKQEIEKSKAEKIRAQKEELDLENKKLENQKLKSEDSETIRKRKESALRLENEEKKLALEMKKLELKQKEEQLKKDPADNDSQFIEAVEKRDLKMLTLLSKNIEQMDHDLIKAAHDIAVEQGDPSVIRLTKVALDKKDKIEKVNHIEPIHKSESKNTYDQPTSVGSESLEVLVPEPEFGAGRSKSGVNCDFTETIVKTMPDGTVMRTTRSTKSMKSHSSMSDDFPSLENRRGSRGFFENSLSIADKRLSSGFSESFFEGRMGRSRLSIDTNFSGTEDFTNIRSMMNNK